MVGLNLTEVWIASHKVSHLPFPTRFRASGGQGPHIPSTYFVPTLMADKCHERTLRISPQKKTQWLNNTVCLHEKHVGCGDHMITLSCM